MRFNKSSDRLWFFCWASTKKCPRRDYPTCIAAYNRSALIERMVKKFGRPWKQIRKEGGRAVRCRVIPVPAQSNVSEEGGP